MECNKLLALYLKICELPESKTNSTVDNSLTKRNTSGGILFRQFRKQGHV